MAINSIHELIPSHLTTKRPAQIKIYFFREKKFTIGIGARKYVDFYLFFTGFSVGFRGFLEILTRA